MVVANVRHTVDDVLTVELKHKTDNPVRRRVVRSKVQEHVLGRIRFAGQPPLLRVEFQRAELTILDLVTHLEPVHFGSPGWMIFTQRMPNPGRRRVNASQARMSLDVDAEHVPHFPLMPVSSRP